MALQISKDTDQGFTAETAYAKITSFNYDDQAGLRFDVKIFFDVQSRQNDLQPIDYISCEIPALPTTDMLPALYNHLKTLPEFQGALDV